jgi:hypothetical protein
LRGFLLQFRLPVRAWKTSDDQKSQPPDAPAWQPGFDETSTPDPEYGDEIW